METKAPDQERALTGQEKTFEEKTIEEVCRDDISWKEYIEIRLVELGRVQEIMDNFFPASFDCTASCGAENLDYRDNKWCLYEKDKQGLTVREVVETEEWLNERYDKFVVAAGITRDLIDVDLIRNGTIKWRRERTH